MSAARRPRLPTLLLRLLVPGAEVREGMLGDLQEEYAQSVISRSRWRAWTRYWRAALGFGISFFVERIRTGRGRGASGHEIGKPEASSHRFPGIPAPRRGDSPMKTVPQDFRQAFRALARQPGFTAVAALTLALGIGATTAIFTLVDAIVLSPLPFDEPSRLVDVGHSAAGRGLDDVGQCAAWHFAYEDHANVFDALGLYRGGQVAVRGDGSPESLPAMDATSGVFRALGTQPVAGRIFTPEDEEPDAPAVVMLGHGYWQSRFAADPAAVGRQLVVDGESMEIVGVVPANIRSLGRDPAIILPLRFRRETLFVGNIGGDAVARLRDGVTIEQAQAEFARIMPMAWEMFPGGPVAGSSGPEDYAPVLVPFQDELVGSAGRLLWILLGGVAVVLLIACANVANLFLVRSEGRATEMAVRGAIGASWSRIGWEYLKESFLLGALGGAGGLALAYSALSMLIASGSADLPRLAEASLSPVVFVFTFCVAVGSSAFFALFPMLRHRRRNVVDVLKQGGSGGMTAKGRNLAQNALAAAQVAMVLVLLVASGLMLRTFQAVRNVDAGFGDVADVLALRITIPSSEIESAAEAAEAFELIAHRLAEGPGVTSVGMATGVPMDGSGNVNPFYVDGVPPPGDVRSPSRRHKWVGEGYFETLQIPLLVGRTFTWADVHNRFPGVILSEGLAREYFGSAEAAMGQRVAARPDPVRWHEVVGVAADVRDDGMDRAAPAMVYWPQVTLAFWQDSPADQILAWRTQSYAIRTERMGEEGFVREVHEAVWSVTPDVPLRSVRSMPELMSLSIARTSFTVVLLGAAAGVALLLGLVGVYGVVSYAVSQRSRELGMRMALGAESRHIKLMVLRQTLVIAGSGIVIGMGLALVVTQLMSSLLYDVSVVDPLTYGLVAAGLLLVAIVSSYIPARRASRVDAMEVLRGS